jgi:hypothetical protein
MKQMTILRAKYSLKYIVFASKGRDLSYDDSTVTINVPRVEYYLIHINLLTHEYIQSIDIR